MSIKNIESEKRSHGDQLVMYTISGQQRCPLQWKKFLGCGSNKTNLLDFPVQEWSNSQLAAKIGDRTLYIAHGKPCTKLTINTGSIITKKFHKRRQTPECFSMHTMHPIADISVL